MTDWNIGWVKSWRANGKPFYLGEEREIKAGYYRFADPSDEKPCGPFKKANLSYGDAAPINKVKR